MTNIPDRIFLQVDADGEIPEDFNQLDVTWCVDKIYDTDIEYKLSIPDEVIEEPQPVQIGTLTKRQGLNGYNVAEIGHPVFEFKDRYIIYLESEKGLPPLSVPYYKETLRPIIQFL